MIEVLILTCTFLTVLYLWLIKRPANFPPGPKPLPVVGNVHQLSSGLFFKTAEKFSKEYGPIVGLSVLGQLMVLVDGVDNVIAALRKEEFQSRPVNFGVTAFNFGKSLGIFFGVGEQWFSSRKFVVKQLRAHGKNEKESVILDEINELMEKIKVGTMTQGNGMFGISAVNVIWSTIANKKIDSEDESSLKFMQNLTDLMRSGNASGGDIVNFFPIFRFIDSKFKFQMKVRKEVHKFIKETIDEHKEVLDEKNPMDLIDHYLVEIKKNSNGTTSYFTEEDLIVVCTDLFAAGAESTSNSIDFILLFMILNPEVQEKMQEELDRVLGRSRKPTLDDRLEMPYTMAVISEVERMNTVAPTDVPHVCTKSTTFGGYSIPKGTMISINLRALGWDPKYWETPEEFKPARFLNSDGKFTKPSHLATFGLGQRACVGEVFARNTIFLFTTMFFEKFSVSLPPREPKPSTVPLPGFTVAPQPFKMSIKSRY